MPLSFKSACNKEHKRVTCNMTSSSNSSQSTHPVEQMFGKNYSSFLDFTHNYEQTSGIFVPCICHILGFCLSVSGIWDLKRSVSHIVFVLFTAHAPISTHQCLF